MDATKDVVYTSVTDGSDAYESVWVLRVGRDVGVNDRELRDVVTAELNASRAASDADLVAPRSRHDFVHAAIDVIPSTDRIAPWLPFDKRQNLLDIPSDARHLAQIR